VHFLSEALRPPPTTDVWRDLVEKNGCDLKLALEGFALIEAQNPREEALVIACALREALETKDRTAALVTPDRGLARRVAAELTRWDIAIDDSAGEKLSRTPPGAFLALAARATAEHFAPVALLALLKHPFAAGGEDRVHFRRNVRALERAACGDCVPIRPRRGRGPAETCQSAAPLRCRTGSPSSPACFEPFAQAMAGRDLSLASLPMHGSVRRETLAATDTESAQHSWRGPAG
jgi:ATP-dependent helicase/nuclease subunit B